MLRPSLIRFIGIGQGVPVATYTLGVNTASFTTTGIATILATTLRLQVTVAQLSTTFNNITLNYSSILTLSVSTATFNTTFPTTGLSLDRTLPVSTANYTTTGYATTLQYNGGYTIEDNYSRSSVNLSGSSISGSGDAAVISILPRLQESEVVGSSRWLEPSARVTGVNGYRPTFKFTNYGSGPYHGYPWQSTRRPMFSYDRETWTYFDTQTINADNIEFRHNTAFTSEPVYISRSRQTTVEQVGAWLDGLESTYPTLIAPTATALAFTPTLTGFSGQTFIADEYSSQLNELGGTIPAVPFYAAEINDTSLMPPSGQKNLAVVIAGVHAGEDHGHIAMRRFIEYLLGVSADAQALRRYYRILIYPMLNAPGNEGGGWRGSFTQGVSGYDDANRHFNSLTTTLEIVDKPRAALATDINGETPDWMLDWHGMYMANWGLHADSGNTNQAELRSRLASNSGFSVIDSGDTVVGFTTRYFQDSLGATLTATMEHGDATAVTDANLSTWGQATVESLASMRADGLLAAPGDPDYSLSVNTSPFTTTFNTVTLSYNQTFYLAVGTQGYTSTLNEVNALATRQLAIGVGAYNTSLNNTTISTAQILPIDTINFTSTFNSVNAVTSRGLVVDPGTCATNFNTANLSISYKLSVDTTACTTSLNNIGMGASYRLSVDTSSTATAFIPVTLAYTQPGVIIVTPMGLTTTFNPSNLRIIRNIQPTTSYYNTSLNVVDLSQSRKILVTKLSTITTARPVLFNYSGAALLYRERIKFEVNIIRTVELGTTIMPSLRKGLEL